MSTQNFVVFYSWQSDLPETRKFIHKSLRAAVNAVMADLPDVTITIDQATRGLTGSPNIPIAIMTKIKAADMVVSDVTPINAHSSSKKTPNPNVLFELGFAVAALGWDRVALMFDAGVGKFPDDTPFDFDKHRAIAFPNGNSKNTKEIAALTSSLKIAIKSTIDADPDRPTATLTPEEVKHKRDVEMLTEIFEKINIHVVDSHIETMPHHFTDAAIHVWESFSAVASGSDFHLNDAELFDLINQFRSAFGRTLSYEGSYGETPSGRQYVFRDHDMLRTAASQKNWAEIEEAKLKMYETFQEILRRVRLQYLEVDLKKTSQLAWKDFVHFRNQLTASFDD